MLLGLALLVALRTAATDTRLVPCAVFTQWAVKQCDNPFLQGVVDGQWIGLVMEYGGGNAEATSMHVYAAGVGGNGMQTVDLGTIQADLHGDRMYAFFYRGKLVAVNAIYLPNEAHCCYTHLAVRQFGFRNRRLVEEKETKVPSGASHAQIRAAISAAPLLPTAPSPVSTRKE